MPGPDGEPDPRTAARRRADALLDIVARGVSEVLERGRAVRLFTPGQRRLLWQRDHGCSYPGCTRPQAWTQAHHVQHWADGGPTDVSDAALLCGRHRTVVHAWGLAATVDDTGVT